MWIVSQVFPQQNRFALQILSFESEHAARLQNDVSFEIASDFLSERTGD